jgi:3-hydroxyisobutyrate dehydrogenase
MAENIVRAEINLAVYNRSSGPRETLGRLGARTFGDPAGLFAACDAVILMLADDAATDRVLGRGTAEFGGRVADKLIVNMGTHAPSWSAALADEIVAAGGRFVEAPVSGSRGPAVAGELVAMVAGEPAAIELLRPILTPVCRQLVVTGDIPSAMACKMAVNLYLIASVAALAEAAALAQRLGVRDGAFAEVVLEGPLSSDVARAKLSKMLGNDFAPQAAIKDVCKNAALVAAAAAGAGLDARLLGEARRRFDAVAAMGGADLDMAAVITTITHPTGPA